MLKIVFSIVIVITLGITIILPLVYERRPYILVNSSSIVKFNSIVKVQKFLNTIGSPKNYILYLKENDEYTRIYLDELIDKQLQEKEKQIDEEDGQEGEEN